MSAQWFHLGLQLKVKIGTLYRIQAQFSAHRDQLREMLKTWLTTSDNSSWKTLTEALRSRSVGASQLASVLETKYCLVETRFPSLPLPPTPSHIPQSPTVTTYLPFPTPTHTGMHLWQPGLLVTDNNSRNGILIVVYIAYSTFS